MVDPNIDHIYEIETKKLDIEIEEKRFKSCCFDLHAESSMFFGRLFISTLIISLCSYQLVTLKQCEYQSLYSSLLTSVISYWMLKK